MQIVLFLIAGLTGSSPERTTVGGQIILGLHAVNGLAILAVTIVLFIRARRFAATAPGPARAPGSATPAAANVATAAPAGAPATTSGPAQNDSMAS